MKNLSQKYNKKLAISFAEIVVVVFIVVVTICIFLGKVFDVSQESDVIYKWKKSLASSQYSYDVLLLTQKANLEKALLLEQPERDKAILDLFKSTLNLEGVSDFSQKKSLKFYKYRFLNGRSVPKNTKYYVPQVEYSPDKKVVVGLNWSNPRCFEDNNLCGIIILDLNGVKMPNRFGLDVFGMNIYKDGLRPFGSGLSYEQTQENCRRLETGVTCSMFYLMGGQFFK